MQEGVTRQITGRLKNFQKFEKEQDTLHNHETVVTPKMEGMSTFGAWIGSMTRSAPVVFYLEYKGIDFRIKQVMEEGEHFKVTCYGPGNQEFTTLVTEFQMFKMYYKKK